MTEPDDDAQPEARRPLTPRRPRRTTTGRPEAGDAPSPAGAGEVRSRDDGSGEASAHDDEPGASGGQATTGDDSDLDAVNRLMAFLRDPDTDR